MPEPAIGTFHRRQADTDGERLWAAACSVRLRDAPRLGRLVRWRIPGSFPDQTFLELFEAYPFVVLERQERALVSGLCGRIWTLARDYPRLPGPKAFQDWDRRGTVKVALAHWVSETAHGAQVFSEARVTPVDRRAHARLRVIWALLGRFERLIGAEALAAATKRAEDSAQGSP